MATSMTQDVAGMRRGIDETNRRFEEAFNSGDPARAAREVYTEDARILPPGAAMVEGRDGIAQFWTAAQQGASSASSYPRFSLSRWASRRTRSGVPGLTLGDGQQVSAKYVVVWKQEGGRWRWHVDIWNMESA